MFKQARLTPEERAIIQDKGTELPFNENYTSFIANTVEGSYLCRQCGLALFRSKNAFYSGCGWPSFDHAVKDHVLERPDADGRRIEITCARCNAHLGHVFRGEAFTDQNTRHCVNALSMEFVTDTQVNETEEAILAAGCFWGVEYLLKQLPGVLLTEVGYSGGKWDKPDYEAVCTGNTEHVEAVRVVFDPKVIHYEALVKYFFEIHDPFQMDGQGPDIGTQYHSAIFYYTELQRKISETLITQLTTVKTPVATRLLKVQIFWPAERYHQNYYAKVNKVPYCHFYTKRFI